MSAERATYLDSAALARGEDAPELRSQEAIHLATAAALGPDLAQVCTDDDRMASAAGLGMNVVAPA